MGKAKSNSGGTSAPKAAAKSPNTGLAHNMPAPPKQKAGIGKGAIPGAGTNPHAGETYNPGERSPTISPFMTGEDIMNYAAARNEYLTGLNELDFNLEKAAADTAYEKDQITKGARYAGANARDDMAARGLQRSSVRDAELFDISATAEMKKTFLDSKLNTLKLHTEAEKHRLEDFWSNPETGYMHGMSLKEISNAQAAGADAPEYLKEPGWEKTPGAAASSKPKTPQKSFQQNAPVPSPKMPSPPPTKTGGTSYPGAGIYKGTAIKGKNYG